MSDSSWSLESRVAALERRTRTLYHRSYAVMMRKDRVKKSRDAYYAALRMRALTDDKKLRTKLTKLACVIRRIREGKRIVLLTPAEMMRFKQWLKNHPGYGPRKSKETIHGNFSF